MCCVGICVGEEGGKEAGREGRREGERERERRKEGESKQADLAGLEAEEWELGVGTCHSTPPDLNLLFF